MPNIKRITDPGDIAKLMNVPDHDEVQQMLGCSKGEWIQYLMSFAEDERQAVWVDEKSDGQYETYLVAIHHVDLPFDHTICILYAWSKLDTDGNQQFVEKVKEWGRELNARSVEMQSPLSPDVYEKYGFKRVATVMEIVL